MIFYSFISSFHSKKEWCLYFLQKKSKNGDNYDIILSLISIILSQKNNIDNGLYEVF